MYKPFIVVLAALLLAASVKDGSLELYIQQIMIQFDRIA